MQLFSVQEIIGGNIFATRKQKYLGEVRVRKGEDIAIFPCEIFHRKNKMGGQQDNKKLTYGTEFAEYWKYCFHYITTSIKGTTNTTAKFCMPANLKGN